ncbi:MAG TPA: hypothetical protein VKB31_07760 [Trueperaceae bacterium]|nr:hypothetical protein [Trueperaceae bacterium]
MRQPGQLRTAAIWGAIAALAFALLVSFLLFLLLGRAGRLGFASFNAAGLVEGVAFVIAYSAALVYVRSALHVPSPTLLSFGLLVPPTAGSAAGPVPQVDAGSVVHTLAENRVVIVEEAGVPVGVTGLRADTITSWEELVKVPSAVAVTELRAVLAHEQLVVVSDGDAVHGVITREMFLAGLWGGAG